MDGTWAAVVPRSAELLAAERDALLACQRRLMPYLAEELLQELEAAVAVQVAADPHTDATSIAAACRALAQVLSLSAPMNPPHIRHRGDGNTGATTAAGEPAVMAIDEDEVTLSFSPVSRFSLALRGCELVARRGCVHSGLVEVTTRLAGQAFREISTGGGDGGGGVYVHHDAVTTALLQVALPALRLYGQTGMAMSCTSAWQGGGGDTALVYDHPLLPLLVALDEEAKGILELTLPQARRPPPPPSQEPGAASAAVASALTACTSVHGSTSVATTAFTAAAATSPLPLELFLALLNVGYVRGRLPYALADVIIDLLDDRSVPRGRRAAMATAAQEGCTVDTTSVTMTSSSAPGTVKDVMLECLSREHVEALLQAAPSILMVDRGTVNGRPATATTELTHGLSTQGYRLMVELMAALSKAGDSGLWNPLVGSSMVAVGVGDLAAGLGPKDPEDDEKEGKRTNSGSGHDLGSGGGPLQVSRLALCCLAHALSRGHRNGSAFLPYSTWLYGHLYGQLVADVTAEAREAHHAIGDFAFEGMSAVRSSYGDADSDAVVLAAVALLRLAASGVNRGDIPFKDLATRRLRELLWRVVGEWTAVSAVHFKPKSPDSKE